MRTVALLGATGSIGAQTIDILRKYPERFRLSAVSARHNAEALFAVVREFRPQAAALVEKAEIPEDLRFCEWFFGEDAAACMLAAVRPDDVVESIVGVAGLPAALAALEYADRLLLANKEALVTGGNLVMEKARRLNKPVIPVDSEHSAIYQCLRAREGNALARIWLTASGGPFRTWNKEAVENAKAEDALRHPNWSMGAKITVDCASMMNKGLEVIEAKHLFGLPLEQIQVTVHPQSVVHSMIAFSDGAVLAQMGKPDMRGPIGYALGCPDRLPYGGEELNFAAGLSLTFEAPDTERFPLLALAYQCEAAGHGAPVILNGANEAAVEAFLQGRIRFGAIARVVAQALEKCPGREVRAYEDVAALDAQARRAAETIMRGME